MTVSDYIEKLKQFPPDMEILRMSDEYQTADEVNDPKIETLHRFSAWGGCWQVKEDGCQTPLNRPPKQAVVI